MGIWEKVYKFGGKLAEKATLLYSGMQIGDNSNDNEKIADAIRKYEVNRSAYEQYNRNEDLKVLQYTVLTFIVIVAIFIITIGIKMLLSENKPPATTSVQSIALTTSREGIRTINTTNSSASSSGNGV